jgi:putative glutamate/gamma-aminobutyrate antiporter
MAFLTAAAVVTSLRGLPVLAEEELTMFAYVGFATLLFLVPAALVAAELGGAFAGRKGGVYAWVGEGFGRRWGFTAIWLQWIQNVVWYPTALSFAAAAAAFTINRPALANEHVYVGLFVIVVYWLATWVGLSGTSVLARVTKYAFLLGTALPGALLVVLFLWWLASGHPVSWESANNSAVSVVSHGHVHPRLFPSLDGLGSLAFLGSILLLFAGVEVQGVHVTEMRNPTRGFPLSMLVAAGISFAVFTFGALAVAGIVPYQDLTLQSGVFDAFDRVLDGSWHMGWLSQVVAALVCYGALGGALAWLGGPSRGLLATARDGQLPPFLQRTNRRGVQRNILLVQGAIVTVIASIYLVTDNVSGAFFLISAMTVSLYIVMYLLMYAAAIRLRRTRPELPRPFRVPGGDAGMWTVAGAGFLAVAFALVVSFVPPSQLPIGSPALYTLLVAAGLVVFGGLPLVIHRFRKPEWAQQRGDAEPADPPPDATAGRRAPVSIPRD